MSSHLLNELRSKIDHVDKQLLDLIHERTLLAGDAKKYKEGAVFVPAREEAVLKNALEHNQNRLPTDALRKIMREVMGICREQQDRMQVAYLGPQGTFTEIALRQHLGSTVEGIACGTLSEVYETAERTHYAIVAIENLMAGLVVESLDLLLKSSLDIVAEMELHIEQCVLSTEKSLSMVSRLYGHEKSLQQCSAWIEKHLPKADKVAVPSNGTGMQRAAQEPGSAALGTIQGASSYALSCLERGVENTTSNYTRFWILGKNDSHPSGCDKTSMVIYSSENAISTVLMVLSQPQLKLYKIHWLGSESSGMVRLWVELSGHQEEAHIDLMLKSLKDCGVSIRVLGSYPAACAHWGVLS